MYEVTRQNKGESVKIHLRTSATANGYISFVERSTPSRTALHHNQISHTAFVATSREGECHKPSFSMRVTSASFRRGVGNCFAWFDGFRETVTNLCLYRISVGILKQRMWLIKRRERGLALENKETIIICQK